ncbi:MAG TPA: SDR family oxidoreductase, partial [Gemmatimonadales bacterium]|nr:SDR family oxidoreductase [Gemmatimonadales bacterium]
MKLGLKGISDQVVVITGGSSGIGLATAILAARKGAKVVLNSRDEADLRSAVEQIEAEGGDAIYHVGDVADPQAMSALGGRAVSRYGRIDTWVNNAGVSTYGRIEEVSLEDARRIFDTNYWGVVHGSLAALPHLRLEGGALINVGSILSSTGYPLQGHYTASKHAVKGFTDSLRIELEESALPVSVTLIQPAAVDTPYPAHAKSYLGVEPKHLPPVYAPEVVAEAIVHCAQRPERNVLVGGAGKLFSGMEKYAPRLGDVMKEKAAFAGQYSEYPDRGTDTLHAPWPGDGRVHASYPGRVLQLSLYTRARLNRSATILGRTVLGAGLALASRVGRSGGNEARRNDRHRARAGDPYGGRFPERRGDRLPRPSGTGERTGSPCPSRYIPRLH